MQPQAVVLFWPANLHPFVPANCDLVFFTPGLLRGLVLDPPRRVAIVALLHTRDRLGGRSRLRFPPPLRLSIAGEKRSGWEAKQQGDHVLAVLSSALVSAVATRKSAAAQGR